MKNLIILQFMAILLCCHGAFAQSINFQSATPAYPVGGLSHTFTSANTPVSINISGNTNRFGGPGGTPRATSTGLYLYTNYPNTSESVTITISFATTVLGLSFNIYDIDQGASNGDGTFNNVDKVTVSAVTAKGVALTPVIGTNGNTSVVGNTITGTASANGTFNTIQLAGPVSSVTITYGNAANAQADPTPQTITIGDLTWGALPVELIGFTGKATKNQIELQWATAQEMNTHEFVVERSSNVLDFAEIGKKEAIGTPEQRINYSFTDAQPLKCINYYRLKQIDFNGSTQVFRPISVMIEPEFNLKIFPNPSDGEYVFIENFPPEADIRLTDLLGIERIFSKTMLGNLLQIQPLEVLNSGLYFLHFREENNVICLPFLVTK